jgi:glycoside hydrolase-like protein
MRYIGYPDNPKCISHYPGAYGAHVKAGRTVLLVAEDDATDPAGGHAGGVAMARRALKDADSVGYPASLPIFFCADGWLASSNISVATAISYLDGAASIMGRQRTGAYGFRDFIEPAKQGGHARWLWLAGQAPSDAELAAGWPHFYQWNNGMIYPGGVEADLDWAYPGVLEALRTATPAPGPAQGTPPATGSVPAWPLPPEQYFGLTGGPAAAHGGINAAERGWIQLIQQALIRKGFVPGITDPGSAWAARSSNHPASSGHAPAHPASPTITPKLSAPSLT